MMELTCCIDFLVTFIIISVSMSKATAPLPTNNSGLKDLADQIAAPLIEAEDSILERAKRDDRPIFSEEGRKDYKSGPDLIPGISPAPGIGLDARIHESNDGVYHGHALRYLGNAADILSTTPFSLTTGSTVTPVMFNIPRDDLRMIQSQLNRWRLDQASVARPRITTPAIAWIQDPNFHAVNDRPEPVFAGSRRMLGPGEDVPKPYIPPIPMLRLNPRVIMPSKPERPAFEYHPYAFSHRSSIKPEAATPSIDQLSPLELFRRLYITTTTRRLRTRKPRPKKPITILPMRDDQFIPEESDMDLDVTTRAKEADADRNKPYPKYKDEEETPDSIRTILNAPEEEKYFEKEPKTVDSEAPYMPQFKSMDRKQFMDHATKSTRINDEQFDQSEFKMAYDKNIEKELKLLQESETNRAELGKIKTEKAEPDFGQIDDEESRKSQELKKPIFERPEIKEINKGLLKDLVSYKAPKIPKFNEEELKDKHLVDLPGLGKKGVDRSSKGAFKEMMAGPNLELKSGHGGEMNEELKALLMPEEESYEPTTLTTSKNADYVEVQPEQIKGIPIRRRRGIRSNIFQSVTNKKIK